MLVTSLALDPIEKKPFAAFHPGSRILSVGSCGCTLHCPWCQNHSIAQPDALHPPEAHELDAEELADRAEALVPQGNIGLAYTYNEPLYRWQDVLACAQAVHARGLVNCMVTNGVASEQVIQELLPHIDAWNIDLKAASQEGYDVCGGRIADVQRTIQLAAGSAHTEVTTLVIPGYNDSPRDLESIARFIASVDSGIVWHLTRFFPHYKWNDRPATPLDTLEFARSVGQEYLDTVVLGNV